MENDEVLLFGGGKQFKEEREGKRSRRRREQEQEQEQEQEGAKMKWWTR